MRLAAYYNEHDEFAAQWLRNLIAAGHIAPGDVDERDLWDVRPDDLVGYSQVHFCAGIGIWSLALRAGGWCDSRPVWTGSFPCQPFSAAGKRLGAADERHLWPAGYHLISVCRPDVVLGEQVASPDGLGWLEGLQADMEAAGYAVGAVDTCAAGFADQATGEEGFHIRQRLYWGAKRLGNADDARSQGWRIGGNGAGQRPAGPAGVAHGLGDAQGERRRWRPDDGNQGWRQRAPGQAGAADWLRNSDGDWQPVEPGTFPLAHANPARVGLIRAYGNALDAAQATGFVTAWMECAP